ncbi:hypothetical protein PHMEG_0009343 [Phytophthora megakarya]|uniref:Uncharacterized protein n=1 Tax=Phytophthora megakarya TaxID=4795 RepID=A0A225WH15_9STRA|nr:hypothetical protein PHMEG_0009343 [Phytophthora megakarya]
MSSSKVISGNLAVVKKVGPDDSDEEPEHEVKVTILRHRVVDQGESDLYPGSYVGHPIAFVQPAGDTSNQWAYGLVTGYSIQNKTALLSIRHEAETFKLQLHTTSTVIAVDRLNYALRTGASVNSTILNALELLDKQNQVIVACGKSRSGLPSTVTSTLLSMPFEPDQVVPLIRPDTLEIVHVRRQHIVDCELTVRGNKPTDVFKDPVIAELNTNKSGTNGFIRSPAANDVDLTFSDSDDEGKIDAAASRQADIDLVRLHNRPLRKRARHTEASSRADLCFDDTVDFPVLDMRPDHHASTFRPSQIERQVRDAIAHPSTQGKNDQAVLESAQQAQYTRFLATPPVLRGSYDLSFGIRGLSLMHFRRFFEEVELHRSIGSTLLLFAKYFYNSTVYDFFKAGADFMEEYAAFARPDQPTCNMLVYWIDSKLGKFRSRIIDSNLQTAALVGQEFSRSDGHLMQLYQSHQDRRATVAAGGRPHTGARSYHSRDQRSVKVSTVPKDLLALLPKQGDKSMCMRYLSKKGCSGPAPGKCFDPSRAHFKPLALPADAKDWIDKHFQGLAAEFQDL